MSSALPPADSSLASNPQPSTAITAVEEEMVERAVTSVLQAHTRPAESSIDRAVAAQVTNDHVTKLLDLQIEREKNRHKEVSDKLKHQPQMVGCILVVTLGFIFFFAWLVLAYQKSDLIVPVITGVGGIIAGGIGGYGLGKSNTRREESP
jgi:hypothetical protein